MLWVGAGKLLYVTHWHFSDDLAEGFYLLSYERPGRGYEENHTVCKPAVVVKHHCGGDQGFSKTRRQCYERILKESCAYNIELVRSESLDRRVDPIVDICQMCVGLRDTT